MAASDVDIANLALSHIGETAEIIALVPNDGSAQSQLAARFYPMARDELLEMHPWTFAMRRQALTLLGTNEASNWVYAYAMPSDCLKPRAVLSAAAQLDGEGEQYEVETNVAGNKVIYTDMPEAVLRYTRTLTDTTKFTPMFTAALARNLAAKLAGTIIKGSAGMQVATAQMKLFLVEYAAAKTDDANTGKRNNLYRDRTPSAVLARTGGVRNGQ